MTQYVIDLAAQYRDGLWTKAEFVHLVSEALADMDDRDLDEFSEALASGELVS